MLARVRNPSRPRACIRKEPSVTRARKLLVWFVLAFAVYALFRSPDQAAGIVRDAFTGIGNGLSSVGSFFDALLA